MIYDIIMINYDSFCILSGVIILIQNIYTLKIYTLKNIYIEKKV